VAGDCNSLAETHAWFDSRVAHQTTNPLKSFVFLSIVPSKGSFLDTFLGFLDTMPAHTVDHLKVNGGRFYYRRRVPLRHQKTLGIKNWNRPCGKVSYQQAVVLVTEWAAKHDAMIEALDNPETAGQVRQETESDLMAPHIASIVSAQRAGALPSAFDPLNAARAGYDAASSNPMFDDQDRLVRFRAILEASFGPHVVMPSIEASE